VIYANSDALYHHYAVQQKYFFFLPFGNIAFKFYGMSSVIVLQKRLINATKSSPLYCISCYMTYLSLVIK